MASDCMGRQHPISAHSARPGPLKTGTVHPVMGQNMASTWRMQAIRKLAASIPGDWSRWAIHQRSGGHMCHCAWTSCPRSLVAHQGQFTCTPQPACGSSPTTGIKQVHFLTVCACNPTPLANRMLMESCGITPMSRGQTVGDRGERARVETVQGNFCPTARSEASLNYV